MKKVYKIVRCVYAYWDNSDYIEVDWKEGPEEYETREEAQAVANTWTRSAYVIEIEVPGETNRA